MPSADVIIPFRERDEWSTLLLEYTVRHWERHFPEFPVIVSDSDPEKPFNRSGARNAGAFRSTAETLIFCDADTVFANPQDVENAVETVYATSERAWFGCKTYFMLSKEFTQDLVHETHLYHGDRPWIKGAVRPPGGVTICGYTAFERAGYYDEGFEGWGYEDSAFHAAMTAMHGPRQFFGDVFHLWHPKPRAERQGQPNIVANAQRYYRYSVARDEGEEGLQRLLEQRLQGETIV